MTSHLRHRPLLLGPIDFPIEYFPAKLADSRKSRVVFQALYILVGYTLVLDNTLHRVKIQQRSVGDIYLADKLIIFHILEGKTHFAIGFKPTVNFF